MSSTVILWDGDNTRIYVTSFPQHFTGQSENMTVREQTLSDVIKSYQTELESLQYDILFGDMRDAELMYAESVEKDLQGKIRILSRRNNILQNKIHKIEYLI